MSIKRLIKVTLLLLLRRRSCKHRWIEKARNVYNYLWSYSDPVPVERRVVIELRCSKCGDVKVIKYKV